MRINKVIKHYSIVVLLSVFTAVIVGSHNDTYAVGYGKHIIKGTARALKSRKDLDSLPGSVKGGVAIKNIRQPAEDLVVDMVKALGKSHRASEIKSHSALSEIIYRDIQIVRETGKIKGKPISPKLKEALDSFKEGGPTVETIKKYSHNAAEECGFIRRNIGAVRPRLKVRDEIERIFIRQKETGFSRHDAINRAREFLRKKGSTERVSDTTLKNWAQPIFK